MTVGLLTAVDHRHEADLVAGLEQVPELEVVRRCADAPELLSVAAAGLADVAIVSAATQFAVQPVAEAFGLGEAYLATQLEIVDGHFTGRVIEPACYGAGKVLLAGEYARKHGLDLGECYFYSDSHHDLPLLESVGYPVAVNPDARLRRIAAHRGWPVMHFY